MGATDITAKICATAHTAIEAACLGEDYGFDCAPMPAQTPDGKMTIVYILTLTKRSPLLGQGPLLTVTQIQSPDPVRSRRGEGGHGGDEGPAGTVVEHAVGAERHQAAPDSASVTTMNTPDPAEPDTETGYVCTFCEPG